MTSRTNSTGNNDNNDQGGDDTGDSNGQQTLIKHAIEYSRTTRKDRDRMRRVVRGLNLISGTDNQPSDPAVPPQNFIEELRRPATSRRRTISVIVDGQRIPILLNPSGKTDPEREAWLWHYIRTLVREGDAG